MLLGVLKISVSMQTAEVSLILMRPQILAKIPGIGLGAPADHHAFLLMGDDLKPPTSLRSSFAPFLLAKRIDSLTAPGALVLPPLNPVR
jgi:hypothetical protein